VEIFYPFPNRLQRTMAPLRNVTISREVTEGPQTFHGGHNTQQGECADLDGISVRSCIVASWWRCLQVLEEWVDSGRIFSKRIIARQSAPPCTKIRC
jgi:hypothetical protein